MYIGEASKITGLSIKSIRFYEAQGVIPAPARRGNYRVYSHTDIELLTLIRETREMGLSVAQIKEIIRTSDGKVNWPKIKVWLVDMRKLLINQIEDLQKKVKLLDECYVQIKSQ